MSRWGEPLQVINGAPRFVCASCGQPITSSDAVLSPQGTLIRLYHDSETAGMCLSQAFQDRQDWTDDEDTVANTFGALVATVGLTLA